MKNLIYYLIYCLALTFLIAASGQLPARAPVTLNFATATLTTATFLEQNDLPDATTLLDKYLTALGGVANLEKATSRLSRGQIEIAPANITAPVTISAKAPQSLLIQIDGGEQLGSVSQGFNGTVAWSKDPQSGVKILTGEKLEKAKLDAEFYRPLKLKTRYEKLTVKQLTKVGNRPAYQLEGGIGKQQDALYFDSETGLLLRLDTKTPEQTTEIYFEDYREVDGIKLPFTTRQKLGASEITLRLTEIKHNVTLAAKLFERPVEEVKSEEKPDAPNAPKGKKK
jgi:outer membrane lipoprotein-sorting protein